MPDADAADADDDETYVTIVKSSDAGYVDSLVALLEAEGISCQHPGKHHAGMLPGFTYIEIPLRVPANREADARALIGQSAADDAVPVGATVFRVKRTRQGVFAIAGWMGALLGPVLLGIQMPGGVRLGLMIAGTVTGYIVGLQTRHDMCSSPSCGAPLPTDLNTCPKCRGTIRGEIKSAREHLAALEALEPPTNDGTIDL